MTEENSFESSILFQISILRKSSKGRLAKKKKKKKKEKNTEKWKENLILQLLWAYKVLPLLKNLLTFVCMSSFLFVCLFLKHLGRHKLENIIWSQTCTIAQGRKKKWEKLRRLVLQMQVSRNVLLHLTENQLRVFIWENPTSRHIWWTNSLGGQVE